MDTLHILNGQSMYNYFESTNFLKEAIMIPFNEAMCYGKTSSNLFTQEFVEIRSKIHHVKSMDYEENTLKPLEPLFRENFTHIELWFDADMFCQINVLTILAWLDQTAYKGSIQLHLVGDKFQPLESFMVDAKGYYALYDQVLIQKVMPESIDLPPLKKGIELYLSYLHNESNLMLYIQEHPNVPEKELMIALLERFKEYGLGDTQYMEIIKNYRSKGSACIGRE